VKFSQKIVTSDKGRDENKKRKRKEEERKEAPKRKESKEIYNTHHLHATVQL